MLLVNPSNESEKHDNIIRHEEGIMKGIFFIDVKYFSSQIL